MTGNNVNAFVGGYVLTHLNGKVFEEDDFDVPTLKFESEGDKLRVSAKVANSIEGTLSYENGKLAGMVISTRMMGPPLHMDVERILSKGFDEGMQVKRNGDELTLSHGDDTLLFTVDKNAPGHH